MSDDEPAATTDDGPPPLAEGIADKNFAERIREERERRHWSQADVALKMKERGWKKWYTQTVQKCETGHRKVTVGEAKALAEIFETTVDRLTWPSTKASAAGLLLMFIVRADRAWQLIADGASSLRNAQGQLQGILASVEKDGYFDSDEIRDLADEARATLALTVDDAVAEETPDEDDGPGEEREAG